MDRDDLIAALERHGTDAAGRAALALRAGASFRIWAESSASARQFLDVWAWRAQCMAEDGIVILKDFEQGLPALRRVGDTPVVLGRVDMAEGVRLVFLTPIWARALPFCNRAHAAQSRPPGQAERIRRHRSCG